MLKCSHRKYLSTGGRMLSAFGGRFERHAQANEEALVKTTISKVKADDTTFTCWTFGTLFTSH